MGIIIQNAAFALFPDSQRAQAFLKDLETEPGCAPGAPGTEHARGRRIACCGRIAWFQPSGSKSGWEEAQNAEKAMEAFCAFCEKKEVPYAQASLPEWAGSGGGSVIAAPNPNPSCAWPFMLFLDGGFSEQQLMQICKSSGAAQAQATPELANGGQAALAVAETAEAAEALFKAAAARLRGAWIAMENGPDGRLKKL